MYHLNQPLEVLIQFWKRKYRTCLHKTFSWN